MKSSDSNHSGNSDPEREAERFVPDRDGPELAYEHVHRYLLAAKLLKGLRVLDLAAGSNYGSLLMQQAGCSMTTLDMDSAALRSDLSGLCGDAQRLPLRDGSFDAVVCFEAIEHVANPEALVEEVQRVLCDRAIFLVSTPDRAIYTDRAGHQNPYHLSEMDRGEFTTLLGRHFAHVRISGQGLWAGSWITVLDEGNEGSTVQRRKVDASRWSPNLDRSSNQPARWASPQKDEFPVPVYLLAACSNSTKGWNRIKRQLSADSVLHDSSQWLLGQYERLVEENTGRNEALEGQIDHARLAQEDLVEQLRTARATIEEQVNVSAAARSSIDLLEEEIRTSRSNADRQSGELARARSTSKEQNERLMLARQTNDDLKSQLLLAARTSADQVVEIDRARDSIDQQRRRLEEAESGAKDMESQIEAARSAQIDLQAQLSAARSAATDHEARLTAARSAAADLEAQLERTLQDLVAARTSIEGFEAEIEAARNGALDLEGQINNARTRIEDNDREIDALEIDKAALIERTATTRTQIERLETDVAVASTRIDELERANSRLWSRIGHRLANWLSRSGGSN